MRARKKNPRAKKLGTFGKVDMTPAADCDQALLRLNAERMFNLLCLVMDDDATRATFWDEWDAIVKDVRHPSTLRTYHKSKS